MILGFLGSLTQINFFTECLQHEKRVAFISFKVEILEIKSSLSERLSKKQRGSSVELSGRFSTLLCL